MTLDLSNRVSALVEHARDAATRVRALLRLSSLVGSTRDAATRIARPLIDRAVPTVAAIVLLVACMGGRWRLASASPQGSSVMHASASPDRSSVTHSPAPPSNSTRSGTSEVAGDDDAQVRPVKKSGKDLGGKLNLNSATEDQLMLLPTVGPAKAERIVTWRKKNGGFRRTADLRRVKGFGYKTFKRLEPFLAVSGDTTLR